MKARAYLSVLALLASSVSCLPPSIRPRANPQSSPARSPSPLSEGYQSPSEAGSDVQVFGEVPEDPDLLSDGWTHIWLDKAPYNLRWKDDKGNTNHGFRPSADGKTKHEKLNKLVLEDLEGYHPKLLVMSQRKKATMDLSIPHAASYLKTHDNFNGAPTVVSSGVTANDESVLEAGHQYIYKGKTKWTPDRIRDKGRRQNEEKHKKYDVGHWNCKIFIDELVDSIDDLVKPTLKE